jgi:hypothetical protein
LTLTKESQNFFDLKDKSLLEMIKTLESDERYKYKTSDEFVNEHKHIIEN